MQSGSLPIVDRAVFIIFIILIAIPAIMPLGLPISISSNTVEVYRQIEGLKGGDIAMWITDFSVGTWGQVGPAEVAIYRHLFDLIRRKGIKVIIVTTYSVDGALNAERILREYIDTAGLKYGEDYVNLGWIPGYETTLAALAKDFQSIVKTDAYGNTIDKLPMLRGVRSISDIALIGFSTSTSPDPYPRQLGGYNKPLIINTLIATVPWTLPYYEKRLITGYIGAESDAAGYEKLTGMPGEGLRTLDAQSLSHIYGVVLIIVGNIWYFTRRREGGRR